MKIYIIQILSIILLALNGLVYSQLTNVELALFRANNVTITDDPTEPQKYWIFSHHGVPSHDYGPFPSQHNPNSVTAQNHNYKIPKIPVAAATPGCLTLGTIAAAVNGVPLFNPYSGPGYNAVEGSNREVFDSCTGHPAPVGAYHYHTVPACLYKSEVDQLIGVALDGYPIYGPLTTGGKTLVSADLDACHGRTVNNKYEYRLTHDYPYILGCYRGEATSTRTGQNGRRRKRQTRPRPGGQQPGGGTGGFSGQSCLYVSFCQNPAEGCPASAYTWDPNASVSGVSSTSTTAGSGSGGSTSTMVSRTNPNGVTSTQRTMTSSTQSRQGLNQPIGSGNIIKADFYWTCGFIFIYVLHIWLC